METKETTLQQFDDRAKVVADRVLAEYWAAIEVLAWREDLTPDQLDAELDRIDGLRARLGTHGRTMSDVRKDLATMQSYIGAIDLEARVDEAKTEMRRLLDAAQVLNCESEDARKAWESKAKEADALQRRAWGLDTFIQNSRASTKEIATQLRDRGHADPRSISKNVGTATEAKPGLRRRFQRIASRLRNIGFDVTTKNWRH